MSAYSASKHHIGLNSTGFVISQKNGKRFYQKKKAPEFVSKTSSGDPAYRDGSYWSYMAQTNWRNGAKQLKWDDPGKFWKSTDVDTSQLEQLTLSRELTSAGQTASGVNVNVLEAWRATGSSFFGDGSDSTLTISADTTDAPIDSACSGTVGTKALTATNVSFVAGQKILIHQTRGTDVGTYQVTKISAYTAGTITTEDNLSISYNSTGANKAQVLVLKQYTAVTIDSAKTLTAKAWNGTVGGILGFICSGTTTVTGTITAAGKGFLGGTLSSWPTSGYSGEGTVGAMVQQREANGSGGGTGQTTVNNTGGGGGGGHFAAGTNGTAGDGYGGDGGTTSGSVSLGTMTFGGAGGAGGQTDGSNVSGVGGPGGGIVIIYTKTLTVTGAISAGGNNGQAAQSGIDSAGGGGGAGGSCLVKVQTATLGTALITSAAGTGGAGSANGKAGGAGSVGRIHLDYLNSYTGTTTPTLDASQDSTLADTPASDSSTGYAGCSNGKIYTWDNATTWTEVFDCRRLEWFESGTDANKVIGDTGGTETAQAQGFQLDATSKVKGVQVYLKKSAGTPGDITVTIETNSTDKPSGTLADASATATIPAFTTSTYGWINVEFASNFSLAATTTFWIVLKTAAAANDQNYSWAADGSSPGYAGGTMAVSTDGASTWAAVAGTDAYFRVLGNSTSVVSSLVTTVGGTKKLYFGVGSPTGTENGDGKLYSYDGTNWALTKIFTTECIICSLKEYTDNSNVYIGTGGKAVVYLTADFSTFTSSKDIDVPQNPGYVYSIYEYNSYLYAGGGSPELIPSQYYSGFLFYYDTTKWRSLYPFDFTVIKSMEFYDAYLFLGTYHGHLYVFDSSTLNPLFNFKDDYAYQVQTYAMKYFDDKLYVALYPQEGSGETNVGIWRFDRRGFSQAHTVSGVTGYRCFTVLNGDLLIGTGDNGYVYKLSTTNYATTGWYQASYFDANLPSINKLWSSVTIRHDPLVSGQSINVYYKFKEADSWTQLTTGADNTVGQIEQTYSFATATYSKKISLKIVLNTTTITGTPKLTETILKYTIYPSRKWQWNFRVKAKKNLVLRDNTVESSTATQLRTAAEAVLSTPSVYAFYDVDGTLYNVIPVEIDQTNWVINPDDINEDEIAISLLEV